MKRKGLHRMMMIGVLLCALLSVSCGGDDGRKAEEPVVDLDLDDDNTTEPIDENYTYTLPVIFHVLYQDADDSTQYVRASRLKEILTYVNELFQGGVYGSSQNVNVRFVMATANEKGEKLATPGVEYVKYTGTYPIDPFAFMSDNTGTNVKYIWDPNDYINVMLYNFQPINSTEGMVLGISHMPYTTKGETALEGLESISQKTVAKRNLKFPYSSSINSSYVYTQSSRYTQADKGKSGYYYLSTDICVTLAHELGHYLGLHHMFSERDGEAVDECLDSDYCEDTPSYNRIAYSEYLATYVADLDPSEVKMSDLTLRAGCDGERFYSANLMDYSVSYGYKFSEEQKDRIRHVLYYSPLIPGPKKSAAASSRAGTSAHRQAASTTDGSADGPIDLPIRIVR